MPEYIEREAAKEAFGSQNTLLGRAISVVLDSVPKADVAPVVCGRWEKKERNFSFMGYQYSCVMCDHTQLHVTNYCPNCGAKMEIK